MKKFIFFMLSLILIYGASIPAFAASETLIKSQTQDQTQTQIQKRLRDSSCQQTEANLSEQQQVRRKLRLQTLDNTETKRRECLEQKDQTGICLNNTERICTMNQTGSASN